MLFFRRLVNWCRFYLFRGARLPSPAEIAYRDRFSDIRVGPPVLLRPTGYKEPSLARKEQLIKLQEDWAAKKREETKARKRLVAEIGPLRCRECGMPEWDEELVQAIQSAEEKAFTLEDIVKAVREMERRNP